MSTLWTFGDSFTDFLKPYSDDKRHWRHKYVEWKGYVPKVFGEIVAEKLNMKLVNKGMGGCDNSYIFEEFCKVCEEIKEGDVVIFGWTGQERFRLVNKDNEWGFFNSDMKNSDGFFSHKPLDSFEFLSNKTITEVMVNREHEFYMSEVCNWIKLINLSLKKIKTIHWSWYPTFKSCDSIHYAFGYKTITGETKGKISDGHWCEESHYLFSEEMIKKIFVGNESVNRKIL